MPEHAQLNIQVDDDSETDPEALTELTYMLREELLELDVDEVELAAGGDAPPGSKGVELAVVGGLIVKMVRSSGLLDATIKTIASWVSRGPARTVRIELDGDVLEVSGVSAKDQRALIDDFVRRRAAAGGQ